MVALTMTFSLPHNTVRWSGPPHGLQNGRDGRAAGNCTHKLKVGKVSGPCFANWIHTCPECDFPDTMMDEHMPKLNLPEVGDQTVVVALTSMDCHSMDELLVSHWSRFDMSCDGSTMPGVLFLKENQSCCVFNERVTFYEHNSFREHDALLAVELQVWRWSGPPHGHQHGRGGRAAGTCTHKLKVGKVSGSGLLTGSLLRTCPEQRLS